MVTPLSPESQRPSDFVKLPVTPATLKVQNAQGNQRLEQEGRKVRWASGDSYVTQVRNMDNGFQIGMTGIPWPLAVAMLQMSPSSGFVQWFQCSLIAYCVLERHEGWGDREMDEHKGTCPPHCNVGSKHFTVQNCKYKFAFSKVHLRKV